MSLSLYYKESVSMTQSLFSTGREIKSCGKVGEGGVVFLDGRRQKNYCQHDGIMSYWYGF